MSLLYGLRKLFTKHGRFTPPTEYRLTPKERESVIVFFSLLGCSILVTLILNIIY